MILTRLVFGEQRNYHSAAFKPYQLYRAPSVCLPLEFQR
jgi:hypothetical protein